MAAPSRIPDLPPKPDIRILDHLSPDQATEAEDLVEQLEELADQWSLLQKTETSFGPLWSPTSGPGDWNEWMQETGELWDQHRQLQMQRGPVAVDLATCLLLPLFERCWPGISEWVKGTGCWPQVIVELPREQVVASRRLILMRLAEIAVRRVLVWQGQHPGDRNECQDLWAERKWLRERLSCMEHGHPSSSEWLHWTDAIETGRDELSEEIMMLFEMLDDEINGPADGESCRRSASS